MAISNYTVFFTSESSLRILNANLCLMSRTHAKLAFLLQTSIKISSSMQHLDFIYNLRAWTFIIYLKIKVSYSRFTPEHFSNMKNFGMM